MRQRLPFPLLGIDSDSGGEFINHHLYNYCQDQYITFTRARPYKKNDQAHVEQRNWTIVGQVVGYGRYESPEALARTFGWRATYQLDWWHLTRAFRRTFPNHPKLVKRLKKAIYQGDGKKVVGMVQIAKVTGVGDPESVARLLTYVNLGHKLKG